MLIAELAPRNKAGRHHGGARGASRPLPTTNPMLVTVQHGAALSGLPYTSVLAQIHNGNLPSVRLPGNRRIWLKLQDLKLFIEHATSRAG